MRSEWRERGPVPGPEADDGKAASVKVSFVRGDRVTGKDEGVLFVDDGRLGFLGSRTSFLLPPASFRKAPAGLGGGLFALAVAEDGLIIGLTPVKLKARDVERLQGLISLAEASASDGTDRCEPEWPPLEDGPRASRWTLRRTGILRITGLCLYFGGMITVCFGYGAYAMGKFSWMLVPLPLLVPGVVLMFVRSWQNTRRDEDKQLRGIPPWAIVSLGFLPMALFFLEMIKQKGLSYALSMYTGSNAFLIPVFAIIIGFTVWVHIYIARRKRQLAAVEAEASREALDRSTAVAAPSEATPPRSPAR